MTLTFFDVIFIVLLGWSAFRGFTKGFIVQLASLAALLLGILGAIKFSGITAGYLDEHVEMAPQYLSLISFAITFILIVLMVHLLGKLIEKLVDAVALGVANRLLGVFFAVAKTAFILSVIMIFINKADAKYRFIPDEVKEDSMLYRPISALAPAIFPYLNFEEVKKQLPDIAPKEESEEDKTTEV
jgi:membrane protein required for colicin V production